MSSFVGIIRWDNDRKLQPQDGERLEAFVALPNHERPTVFSVPPAHVAYCQKVTTPEDRWERQPARAGNIISLFDGRIDDREDMVKRLKLSFTGVPDGSLALAAFQHWGADAPREVLGEFAWAVWDGTEQRLILARDTSASRSLYVCRTDQFVAFATGLRALFSLPEIPREVDDQGLAEFMVLHPGHGGRTIYRDVVSVIPGTTLIINRKQVRQITNWEPHTVLVPRDPIACAEAAREVLGRAVQARLRMLGPTAISLSGGLDSSIVVAEAARQRTPEQVIGFALVPPSSVPLAVSSGWAADGRPQLEALARAHPNLHVKYIEPGADPIGTDPTALFSATCHPIGLSPNFGWLLAAWRAASASGARVLLTGDDGELSLTHYGSLRAMVQQWNIWHALREAWLLSGRRRSGFLMHADIAFLGGRLTWLRNRERRSRVGNWQRYSPIHPDLAESTRMREFLLAEKTPGGQWFQPPGYAETLKLYLRRRTFTIDNLVALRTLSGLDQTCPFADRRVLEFCLSLPEVMFIRDGRKRWLARTAFRDLLPPEVRDNAVKTEQNPEWFHHLTLRRSELREQLEHIETSSLANRALDIPRLRGLLERWPASVEEANAAGPAYRSTLVRGLHVGHFCAGLIKTTAVTLLIRNPISPLHRPGRLRCAQLALR